MNAFALTTALLVALIKTPGEGGAVTHPYADTAACEDAGAELQAELQAIDAGNGVSPKVIWACIPG